MDPYTGLPSFSGRIGLSDLTRNTQPVSSAEWSPAPKREQPTYIGGGLRSGANVAHAMLAGAAAAGGRAFGADSFADRAEAEMVRNLAEAEQYGRSDLETAPWREGGSPFFPWLTYQAAKQIPQWLPALAAGAVSGGSGTVAAVAAGASAAAQGAGSMYEQARANDGVATAEEAQKALMLSPVYGAAETLAPFGIGKAASKTAGPLLTKALGSASTKSQVMRGLGMAAAGEAATESIQTGMELSFRDDMTAAEKAREIVDAALTGGLIGGTFAGPAVAIGATRRAGSVDPQNMTTDDMERAVDEVVAGPDTGLAPVVDTRGQQVMPDMVPPETQIAGAMDPATQQDRPLAGMSSAEMIQQLSTIEQQMAGGQAASQHTQARALLRAELQRREQEAQAGSPLAGEDTAALQQALGAVQARMQQGKPTQADVQLARSLEQELTRRQPEAATEQDNLFGDLPEQLTGNALKERILADEAETAKVTKVRETARKLAGGKSKFIDSIQAKNGLELGVAVYDQLALEDNSPKGFSASTFKLAKELGVVNDEGLSVLERDLDQELVDAQRGVDLAQRQFKAMDGRAQEAKKLKAAQEAFVKTEARVRFGKRLQAYLQAREDGATVPSAGQGLEPTITKVPARSEVAISREAGVAPEVRSLAESYDVTLPDGATVNLTYNRKGPAAERGWTLRDGTKVPLAEGEKGAQGAAAAVVRMQEAGTLPREAKIGADINEPTSAGNRYRRGDAGDVATVARDDVAQDVESAIQGLTNAPNVRVVASTADLPTDVAQGIVNDRAEDAAGMVTKDGEIYLFTDNMTSREEGVATLYHEMLGHKGLSARFRGRLDGVLKELYRGNKKLQQEADQWLSQYPDAYANEADRLARGIEEVLAIRSEAGRMDTGMFAKLARVVKQFLRRMGLNINVSDAEVDVILAMAHKSALAGTESAGRNNAYRRNSRTTAAATPHSIGATSTALKGVSKLGDKALQAVKDMSWERLRPAIRDASMGWTTTSYQVEQYGEEFTDGAQRPFHDLQAAKAQRTAIENLLAQQNVHPMEALRSLQRTNPAAGQQVLKLMGMTYFRIDPRKTWQEHTWLHDHQDVAKLRKHHTDAVRMYRSLDQSGNSKVYRDLASANRAMYASQNTMMLYAMLAGYSEGSPQPVDPMTQYQHEVRIHRNSAATQKFWDKALKDVRKRVEEKIGATVEAAKKETRVAAEDMLNRAQNMEELLEQVRENMKYVDEAPYFHLARFGDHFASFHLPVVRDDKGRLSYDEAKVDRVREKLSEAGFDGLEIPDVVMEGRTAAFMRVENEREATKLHNVLSTLSGEGVSEIRSGPIEKSGLAPVNNRERWINTIEREMLVRQQEAVAAAQTDEEAAQVAKQYNRTINQLKDLALRLMPDISSAKVMARRMSVAGFDADHMRAYAHRAQVASHSLARLSTNYKIQKAFAEMEKMVDLAKNEAGPKASAMQAVLVEQETREDQRATQPERSWVDSVRAWNHAYFLGLSPAYLLTNLTQVPVLLLPELGKKHGYVKSSKAIAKVTGDAFKVVNAAFTGGGVTGRSWLQAVEDPLITLETLEKAGVEGKMARRVMRLVNTGLIDIGSAAREMGRIEENRLDKPQDRMLRMAGAFGLYSEMTTRLIAALSAYELSDAAGMGGTVQEEYVSRVVNQSMLNYTTDNVARAAGRQGFIGKYSPLPLAFMQYTMQLLEKLFREAYVGFGGGSSDAQTRAEARRFLYGHATVVGMLSGTLGLPGASLFATLIGKMADWFGDDDEPYDAVAEYRNFLADVFGKDVAEIIARGVPRAINLDMSVRAGEQDIIPFTRFLTDKRDWREKLTAASARFGGSPYSMLMNLLEGGQMMASGDYVEGLKRAVPVALKGPIEATRMSAQGYLDKNGNELPMDADTRDIFVQFFGFSPSEKAEYSEANFAQIVRDTQLRRKASSIRKQLVQAVEQGDQEKYWAWLEKAKDFDADNPAYDVLPSLSQTLKRRQKEQAMAAMYNMPLRGNVRDPGSQSLTRYANFGVLGATTR